MKKISMVPVHKLVRALFGDKAQVISFEPRTNTIRCVDREGVKQIITLGGAGSGNFGHAGRPGEVGGSGGGGGSGSASRAEHRSKAGATVVEAAIAVRAAKMAENILWREYEGPEYAPAEELGKVAAAYEKASELSLKARDAVSDFAEKHSTEPGFTDSADEQWAFENNMQQQDNANEFEDRAATWRQYQESAAEVEHDDEPAQPKKSVRDSVQPRAAVWPPRAAKTPRPTAKDFDDGMDYTAGRGGRGRLPGKHTFRK